MSFIGVIYFIFSYGMSWASRQLETQLGVGGGKTQPVRLVFQSPAITLHSAI